MTEEDDRVHPDPATGNIDEEKGEKETDTKPSSKITRRQFFVLASLIYNQFWGATCYSIQAPFFPKEAESKGATSTEYGMVFSIFELVVLLMSPVYGRMIPEVSPKFLIVAGSFVQGGSCTLFGVLDRIHGRTSFIVMAFLVRIVEGLGAAAFNTAIFTVIASEFPGAIGRAFSFTETFFGFGLIAGPTIGGLLYQVGGFLLPFVVCGGMLLIGSVVFIFILPSIEDTGVKPTRNYRKFLTDPAVLMHIFALFACFLFIGFNAGTLEPHLRQFDLKPAILGLLFVIMGGVYAFTAPLWGWLADKGVSSYTILISGYILGIVGALFIGPVPFIPFHAKIWTVIVSLVVLGLGAGARFIASFTGAFKIAPTLGFPDSLATQGMISGILSFAGSLGAFAGPSLGGFLLDTTGYEAGTYVIVGEEIFFLSLLLAVIAWKNRNSPNEERTPPNEERTPILRTQTEESSTKNYSTN